MKGSRLWGVAALCVLSGSGWLLQQAWPSEMAWPFGSCLHFGLIGILGLGATALRNEWQGLSWRRFAALGIAGMCLFSLPSAAFQITAGKVPEYTSAALFCAVPLMTILASSASGSEGGDGSRLRGLMVPSTIGLAGALLLFPVQSPDSLRRWLFLVLVLGCCIVVAIASVCMHRLIQGASVALVVATLGLGSAAVLGCDGASVGWPRMNLNMIAAESLRCAVFDLPVVWLTVWLVREVAPVRLSARFLLVPLVTILEGYWLDCGSVELRAMLALGLLGIGGTMVLFKVESSEAPGLRLR